jgi:S-formylglutathione hydrolase FrmB
MNKAAVLLIAVIAVFLPGATSGQDVTVEPVPTAWQELPGFKEAKPWPRLPGYWKIHLEFDSPSNQRKITTAIYVPPQYLEHPDARFPVVYTLQVFEGLFIEAKDFLQDHPMILVAWSSRHPAPGFRDGYDLGWWINSTTRPQCQLETFFFDELHPFMSEHFRIAERVAITGFSSGAYAAHLYMLQRPGMFSSGSGMDARYFAAGYGGTMQSHITRWYGPYNEQTKKDHDAHSLPLLLKAHVKNKVKLPPMLGVIGYRSYLLEDNRRWAKLLSDQNLKVVFDLAKASGQIEGFDPEKANIFGCRQFMHSDYFKEHYPKRSIDYQYLEVDGVHSVAPGIFTRVAQFHWEHSVHPVIRAAAEAKQ